MSRRSWWQTWGVALWLAALASFAPTARGADDAPDVETLVSLLELVLDADHDSARKSLAIIAEKVQSRELAGETLKALRERLDKLLDPILAGPADHPLHVDAALTAATWGHPKGLERLRAAAGDPRRPEETRRQAIEILAFVGDSSLLELLPQLLADRALASSDLRGATLAALGRWDEPKVAPIVLASYAKLEPESQARAIELLAQRPAWAKPLLEAIGRGDVPRSALNANQVARLQHARDPELQALVRRQWGTLRTERNPAREKVIAEARRLLAEKSGDPHRGHKVFHKVCGQCHKIHGTGQEVGPDLTANGRSTFEQLLSNVLDPSLVIGPSYQARTIITSDGRVLTGLLVEDSEQRVVLKMQGGKLEAVAREDVDELRVSQLSLMPEGLETQLPPEEFVDLFAFLVLDKPPTDPMARRIPAGEPTKEPRSPERPPM